MISSWPRLSDRSGGAGRLARPAYLGIGGFVRGGQRPRISSSGRTGVESWKVPAAKVGFNIEIRDQWLSLTTLQSHL